MNWIRASFRWHCAFTASRTYGNTAAQTMKYLNVAEKNDAAKTISNLLSRGTSRRREGYSKYNKIYEFECNVRGQKCDMIMTSVSGHLLQLEFLPSYRHWRAVDPKSLFDAPIRKQCSSDFEPIKRTLEREVRKCGGLIIWTDCDREGENIGFEIIDVCRAIKPNIKVFRAKFSEITTAAVQRALGGLGEPDKRQSEAVDVRTELDLRTGAAITRFQTLRLQRLFPEKIAEKLISYGSCQIPTLGFVAERYKDIEAFVSEAFWKIKVTHTIGDLTVNFNWSRDRLFDKEAVEGFLMLCLEDPRAKVKKVTVKPKHKWRPTPLDTVEMEKLGSRKLKLSAKETMSIAEKLYTQGIISYPRTETNQFSKEFDLRPLVAHQTEHPTWGAFAQRVVEWGPNPRNGNKSDQAHPPIHPTKLVTNLSGNEARVYELVVRHFLACVSKDAVGSETVVKIDINSEEFTATGLCIYELNYLEVYVYEKWNAKQIHKYEEGQIFEPTDISMAEGATTAPPLLTEADLIALMEKHGIGTDATHAEHINTIKERGYIGVIDKGFLVPGIIGMGLYEGYNAMELELAQPLLRAEFEKDLKRICLGEKDPKLVLSEQIIKYKEAYQKIMDKISAMDEKIAARLNETPRAGPADDNGGRTDVGNDSGNAQHAQELFKCPKCGVASLALKPKKNQTGYLIGCLNYPDCKNVVWFPDECKEPLVLDECCAKCGNDVKLLKLKFETAYYRTLFTAPHGWYKTCIRCDAQFRSAFNINLENVKAVGRIIDVEAPSSFSHAPVGVRPGTTSSTLNSAGRPPTQSNRGRPKNIAERKPQPSKVIGTAATTGNNIRNYFTVAAPNSAPAEDHLRGVQLDELFDSNDSFDKAMISMDSNPTTHREALAVAAPASNDYSADLAAVFADDDDDDDGFSGFNCIASNNRPPQPPPSPPAGGCMVVQERLETSYDSPNHFAPSSSNIANYSWGTSDNANSQRQSLSATTQLRVEHDYHMEVDRFWDTQHPQLPSTEATLGSVNCSGCHMPGKLLTTKREGPNKGRPYYICPKIAPCKFFQWADEQSDNSGSRQTPIATDSWGTGSTRQVTISDGNASGAVSCHCGQPARSLIVRKDGPNKGRSFYSCCSTDKGCGFFQWNDAPASQASTSTSSSNTNARAAAGSNQSLDGPSTSSAAAAKRKASGPRKCGLCRAEGHTKLKCPRKAEFEY